MKVPELSLTAIVDVKSQDGYAVILERLPDLLLYGRTRRSAGGSVMAQVIESQNTSLVRRRGVGFSIQSRE